MSPNVAQQAEQRKQEGNHCFTKNRFGAAIDAYTEAITLCPNVPIYWTNRALCHRKRNDWTRVEEDCKKAIQLDQNSVKIATNVKFVAHTGYETMKAHYMLGLALLQRKEYSEGIRELERAMDFGRGANPHGYMIEEIWQELAKAKYLQWEDESTKRSWDLRNLKEACEAALREKYLLDSADIEGILNETKANSEHVEGLATDIQGVLDEKAKDYSQQLKALDRVFKIAADADTPTEVPDHLCCKITLEIFRDPVIAPSGFTYERAVILDHLHKVGTFDPISREPLFASQLVPNLAIKEAVETFLDKNGWAYKMD